MVSFMKSRRGIIDIVNKLRIPCHHHPVRERLGPKTLLGHPQKQVGLTGVVVVVVGLGLIIFFCWHILDYYLIRLKNLLNLPPIHHHHHHHHHHHQYPQESSLEAHRPKEPGHSDQFPPEIG